MHLPKIVQHSHRFQLATYLPHYSILAFAGSVDSLRRLGRKCLKKMEMVDTNQELGHFMVSYCGDSAWKIAQLVAQDAMDIDGIAQELLPHIGAEKMDLDSRGNSKTHEGTKNVGPFYFCRGSYKLSKVWKLAVFES